MERRNSMSGVASPVEALIHALHGHDWAMQKTEMKKKLGPRLARTRARSGRVEAGFKDERERERRDATHILRAVVCPCGQREVLGECGLAGTWTSRGSCRV